MSDRLRRCPRLELAAAVCGLWVAPLVAQRPTAFVDVTVVPLDSERVMPGQTVVVQGSTITRIGPTGTVGIPGDALVIEGRGKYLMPGLADMHVHFMHDSTELLLYLANGVTTVRELSGEAESLRWREEIEAGARVGPNVLVTSPLIDGARGKRAIVFDAAGTAGIAAVVLAVTYAWGVRRRRERRARLATALVSGALGLGLGYWLMGALVPFPDFLVPHGRIAHWYIGSTLEAAAAVRRAARQYDQIKLYDGLTRAQFFAATRAARRVGIHTVAHVPPAVGLQGAIEAGLDELAHVYFLVEELQATTDTAGLSPPDRDAAYDRRMVEIVSDVRRASLGVTATLMPLPELVEQYADSGRLLGRSDRKYRTSANIRLIRSRAEKGETDAFMRDLDAHIRWAAVAVRELGRAGSLLVLGTDASPITVLAGFSVHDELRALIRSGLTPYQALRAGTVNAARIHPAPELWGTVSQGARADLLLIERNPLEDVAALRQPLGVMVRGRWYDGGALRGMLDRVAAGRAAT